MLMMRFKHIRRIVVAAGCFLALSLSSLTVHGQQSNEQMASYYYQNQEYDKAAELYESLYQRTQNKYYYQMLYESYMALALYKDVEKLVERRIKQHPAVLFKDAAPAEIYTKCD